MSRLRWAVICALAFTAFVVAEVPVSTDRCLEFDGEATTAVIEKPSGLKSLDGSGVFTFEAWIRPRTQGGGGRARILQQIEGRINWYLSDDRRFGFRAGKKAGWRLSAQDAIHYWEWQHVAVTSDGTRLRFFVAGKLAGSIRKSIVLDANDSHLWIGNGFGENGKARGFDGWIDELRISNACLYTSDFEPPESRHLSYDSSTVVLFHFDESPTIPFALDATTFNAEIQLDDPLRGTRKSPRRVTLP